ncbi:hypothetical protein RCCGEPOP_17818 [Rhizobium sp. Pop5]|nr:hypothetical protein RCCGEPOP_17818 [Rhizobium sp. Pop5]
MVVGQQYGALYFRAMVDDGAEVLLVTSPAILGAGRYPKDERMIVWMRPGEAASLVNGPELRGLLRCMEKHSA